MMRILAFLVAVAVLQFAAFAQPAGAQTMGGSATDRAASAAEAVAARATGTFEAIDPDSEMPSADEAAAAYAGLPPLAGGTAVAASAPVIESVTEADAPRGPAVRMISEPVVQAIPARAPAAAAAPKTAAPVAAASSSPFVIKSILPIEGSIRYGDWFWDESAAPRSGALVITVDLQARVISAFRDGHEIAAAGLRLLLRRRQRGRSGFGLQLQPIPRAAVHGHSVLSDQPVRSLLRDQLGL